IRGVFNRDFNGDDAYRIGYYLPHLLDAKAILIGRDARASTEEIYEQLTKGITDAGADVVSIGLATTPMVYYATAKHGFEASVQITASHNPPEYNGMKVSRANAVPVGYDTGLSDLEEMIKKPAPGPVLARGSISEKNILPEYIDFMKSKLGDLSGLKIGVDCSNGMAGLLIRDILGEGPEYIFEEIDGTFPNHAPNPLDESNLDDIKKLVDDNNLDIGVIFDGDADRVMFIDELGRFIRPDLIIAVIALQLIEKPHENILYDIRTSRAVTEYIEKLRGTPNMWKVGHSHAKVKMKQLNAVFGGELAGHYYFRDFFFCDSGILAALIVLNITAQLKEEGQTISSMIESINTYANSGEVNFRIQDKQAAMNELKRYFT
ncbi:phosphoglucomutase, partial [bacterium E08(2017)]